MVWASPGVSPRAVAIRRNPLCCRAIFCFADPPGATQRPAHPSPARAINRAPHPDTALRGQGRESSSRVTATPCIALQPLATRRDAHPSFALNDQKGTSTPAAGARAERGKPRSATLHFARHRSAPLASAPPRYAALPHRLPVPRSRTGTHLGQPYVVKTGKTKAFPRIALRLHALRRQAIACQFHD